MSLKAFRLVGVSERRVFYEFDMLVANTKNARARSADRHLHCAIRLRVSVRIRLDGTITMRDWQRGLILWASALMVGAVACAESKTIEEILD